MPDLTKVETLVLINKSSLSETLVSPLVNSCIPPLSEHFTLLPTSLKVVTPLFSFPGAVGLMK